MRATTKALFWVIILLAIIVVSLAKDCGKQVSEVVQQEIPSAHQAKEKSDLSVSRTRQAGDVPSFHKVARVVDGEEIQLDNGEKVRYIGVDTPETKHPGKPVEYFGKEAAAKNKKLVGGKNVRLEFDVQKRDKYVPFGHRRLALVSIHSFGALNPSRWSYGASAGIRLLR